MQFPEKVAVTRMMTSIDLNQSDPQERWTVEKGIQLQIERQKLGIFQNKYLWQRYKVWKFYYIYFFILPVKNPKPTANIVIWAFPSKKGQRIVTTPARIIDPLLIRWVLDQGRSATHPINTRPIVVEMPRIDRTNVLSSEKLAWSLPLLMFTIFMGTKK